MSLEESASRVLAAQVAGLIALWTQLYPFENGPPEVMAWVALFIFVGSICVLGAFLRPRRLVRFWDRALPDELFGLKRSVTPEEEAGVLDHISSCMRRQRDTLELGIRVSVPLGILALCVIVVAYAIEKRWYAP
jgi:hypothetical protein